MGVVIVGSELSQFDRVAVNFQELGGPPHPSMERGSHHDHALLPLISEKGFMPAAPTMGAAGATFEAP